MTTAMSWITRRPTTMASEKCFSLLFHRNNMKPISQTALFASTSHILATTTRCHSSSSLSSSPSINNSNPPSVTLYQYQICPFCNINKALLNYTNIPYEKIEVNPLTKSELNSLQSKSNSNNDKSSYKKVPIAIIDNEHINDSTEINKELLKHPFIIHNLEATKWNDSNNNNNNIMSIEQFASSEEAIKWTEYAHKELAPVLYPNICKSLSESYDAFGYVHDVKTFTTLQKGLIRVIGSFAMYIAASKIKCMYEVLVVYVYHFNCFIDDTFFIFISLLSFLVALLFFFFFFFPTYPTFLCQPLSK